MYRAAPPNTTIEQLCDRYDVLLLDAYGVLVDAKAALPGAVELVDHLNATGKQFFIVTNDASRLPETSADRYRKFGMDISADRVITSGSLLGPAFRERGLQGARCFVLGPHDSRIYVERAGGVVIDVDAEADVDACIIGDEDGYPFLETVDATLSALIRLYDRGSDPALLLPNPDLIYPAGPGRYGFTSGGAALLLEAGLARRFPERAPTFSRLGKPHQPMYDEARRRAGTDSLIMIGDQLETDIAGARAAGIDAALLTGGISSWSSDSAPERSPNYLLSSLRSSTP